MKLTRLLPLACCLLPSVLFAAPPLAFPGAEGFGAPVTGGRAGPVYHVTNLNDSGAGSLRDVLSESPRFVVFDVGGTITLQSNLSCPSNMTIAGQSAPAPGITIYNRSLSLSGNKNIILRYLRVREGINGDSGKCSINAAGSSQLMLDHLSIEWGRWDNLGLTQGAAEITLQYCIVGQSIDPQRFGALIDSAEHITLSHNLWIHNQSRNPKAKGTIQYINNVVYNWGGANGLVGGHSAADHALDAINNLLIKGPSSTGGAIGQFTKTDHVFQTGNLVDLDTDGTLSARGVETQDFGKTENAPTFMEKRQVTSEVPVTVETVPVAYERIVKEVGASLHRDAMDKQLIADLTSLGKSGKIIKSDKDLAKELQEPQAVAKVSENSGSVVLPDNGVDASGYTHLELYLNQKLASK